MNFRDAHPAMLKREIEARGRMVEDRGAGVPEGLLKSMAITMRLNVHLAQIPVGDVVLGNRACIRVRTGCRGRGADGSVDQRML